ncbi:MAG: hypothetical protein QOI73_682 [Solirubrobacteraceae bacterium]|nr:hypothetical protein [Solirubrobacteraceae bacterium]
MPIAAPLAKIADRVDITDDAVAAGARGRCSVNAARLEHAVGRVLPGLLLVGGAGLVAHLAARQAFPYALAIGFEVPLAMLLGLIVVNVGAAPAWAAAGIRFAVRNVLKLGIILLGLRLNFGTIAVIGTDAIGLVLAAMCSAVAFALIVGRRLGVQRRVAVLIGVGSSVCGNSAILAVAPVLKADEREVSSAVATITIFGTLAVFVFPLVGHLLDLDVLSAGLWAGTSVPDTAQTIAASAGYSTVGRDVATVVKLVRNVLMVPLLLIIAWAWARYGDNDGVSSRAARRGAVKAFPIFLLGFLALAMVRSAHLVDVETVADVDVLTRACFVIALAGLGMQTQLAHIRAAGPRPFVLGFGTSGLLAGGSLAAILALGLGPARTEVVGGHDPRPQGAWTTVCREGTATAFSGAFERLSQQLPQGMGRPRGCATVDSTTGDTVQRTTRGVATLSRRTGRATFHDSGRSWSIEGSRLLTWSADADEPPVDARSRPLGAPAPAQPTGSPIRSLRLAARVLAAGIPGAGALSPVGAFHPGGPIHDTRSFAATTRRGKVLDPARLLVASSSNFGAPLARPDWSPGAILSLATDARAVLRVPPNFAESGVLPSALQGDAQLYSAQAPSFLNRVPDSGSPTAGMPAVSNPLGISVNNGFGRPWVANAPAPAGAEIGVETVLDPDGRPLADPPSEHAGGVFAGDLTNRSPQRRPGALLAGAIGNALLGASPDATNRAVFAVATADGALAQVHVEDGVDGLAPPGTLAPLATGRPGAPTRTGMVFNWVPDRFLYVADAGNDALLQLHLDDDFRIFEVVETRRLASRYFSMPVDIAPAVPEIANPAFSSNTTAAGGADLYVANRGSGTIVRVRQDGGIVAVARPVLPGLGAVGAGRLNGIAVAPDGDRIWLSLSGSRGDHPRLSGSVIEIPAFGASR